MKRSVYILLCLSMAVSHVSAGAQTMKYDRPAENFNEALPLGNGHIGAMVYGGVGDDKINLNESTLWGGRGVNNNPVPDGPERLARVREALFAEQWEKARQLLVPMQGPNAQCFLPMGDIHIRQSVFRHSRGLDQGDDTYLRTLDLDNAVARTSFIRNGIRYEREYFVSYPDRVMVIHLTSSEPGTLNFSLDGDSPWPGVKVENLSDTSFCVSGQLGYYMGSDKQYPYVWEGPYGERGMRYRYIVKLAGCDGECFTAPGLRVSNASYATVLISAATSYAGFDRDPDGTGVNEKELAEGWMRKAGMKSLEALRESHIADYKEFADRVDLNLAGADSPDLTALTTDERLRRYADGGADPGLERMYFRFGRYLLTSCSREDSVPANLQGIWNDSRHPSWGSEYTTNINLEMNYWPAEPLAMSELAAPLFRFTKAASFNGAQVVRNMYGMRGWTIHHNSDIWAAANPVGEKEGDPKWANWAMGGPWLCQHLFEHYRFTKDEEFLRDTAYPLMKGATEFLLDWLVEKDGEYITAPSTSPENMFIDDNGNKGVVTMGSAMDLEIAWDLLTNVIEASEVLGTDQKQREHWKEVREMLHPLQTGAQGNLVEWYKDWEDADPQHRHVSHLFGLYPGRQISPFRTLELAAAARKTLEIRGDGGTGWSKAWKICFWARLLDGDHSYLMFRELLSRSTLPNLFDNHPSFQIDGNFGSIAGVAEMLLQSQNDELHLLPALPAAWREGSVSGLQGRGAFSIDISWKDGRLKEAFVLSKRGGECVVRTSAPVVVTRAAKGRSVSSRMQKDGEYFITTFKTSEGESYKLFAY